MFTLDQVNEAHETHGNEDTLLAYAHALRDLGVLFSHSFVLDGRTEFVGANDYTVTTPAYHEQFEVSERGDQAKFDAVMRQVENGELGYVESSARFAEAGVERWTIDTENTTFTYFDRTGAILLQEHLADL